MVAKNYSIFPFILTFLALHVSGQKEIVVSGKFKPKVDDTQLSVYKPIASCFNMSYPDAQSETAIKDSEFKVSLTIDKPGFIRLQSKGMPKTYFYAEPGDAIQILFTTDSAGITKTIYSGNNARANNLLSDKMLLNDFQFLDTNLPAIFMVEDSVDKLFQSLVHEIEKCTDQLKILLKDKQITESCFKAMTSETEQILLFWTNTYFNNYFIGTEELSKKAKISREGLGKLASKLYSQYDPYSSKNEVATKTYNNALIKSILIEDKVIASEKVKTPFWSQYEKQFSMIVSRLSAIDYAPVSVQMSFMGTSLVTATVFKPMSEDDFIKIFNTYYSKFPNSPFNSIITSYLAESTNEKNVDQTKFDFGLYLLANKNEKLIEQDFKGIDSIPSVRALIKKHFRGSPVFVDFWATWCSPCIAEFRNEPELHKFLESHNIKTLYVSIDNKRAMQNWKRLIGKYQLTGYHYLANQEVRDNVDKWFFGIPRYMLFNEKGEVLNDNLLRPSEQQKLFEQINSLLR